MFKFLRDTKLGFSMIEMMLLLVVLSLLTAASMPILTKKHRKAPEKAYHGRFVCFWQVNSDGTQTLMEHMYSGENLIFARAAENQGTAPDQLDASCSFDDVRPTKVNHFYVQVVGGGGAGGAVGRYSGNVGDSNSGTEIYNHRPYIRWAVYRGDGSHNDHNSPSLERFGLTEQEFNDLFKHKHMYLKVSSHPGHYCSPGTQQGRTNFHQCAGYHTINESSGHCIDGVDENVAQPSYTTLETCQGAGHRWAYTYTHHFCTDTLGVAGAGKTYYSTPVPIQWQLYSKFYTEGNDSALTVNISNSNNNSKYAGEVIGFRNNSESLGYYNYLGEFVDSGVQHSLGGKGYTKYFTWYDNATNKTRHPDDWNKYKAVTVMGGVGAEGSKCLLADGVTDGYSCGYNGSCAPSFAAVTTAEEATEAEMDGYLVTECAETYDLAPYGFGDSNNPSASNTHSYCVPTAQGVEETPDGQQVVYYATEEPPALPLCTNSTNNVDCLVPIKYRYPYIYRMEYFQTQRMKYGNGGFAGEYKTFFARQFEDGITIRPGKGGVSNKENGNAAADGTLSVGGEGENSVIGSMIAFGGRGGVGDFNSARLVLPPKGSQEYMKYNGEYTHYGDKAEISKFGEEVQLMNIRNTTGVNYGLFGKGGEGTALKNHCWEGYYKNYIMWNYPSSQGDNPDYKGTAADGQWKPHAYTGTEFTFDRTSDDHYGYDENQHPWDEVACKGGDAQYPWVYKWNSPGSNQSIQFDDGVRTNAETSGYYQGAISVDRAAEDGHPGAIIISW